MAERFEPESLFEEAVKLLIEREPKVYKWYYRTKRNLELDTEYKVDFMIGLISSIAILFQIKSDDQEKIKKHYARCESVMVFVVFRKDTPETIEKRLESLINQILANPQKPFPR